MHFYLGEGDNLFFIYLGDVEVIKKLLPHEKFLDREYCNFEQGFLYKVLASGIH